MGQLFLAGLNGVLSLILLLATGSALPLLFAAVALVCALIPLIGIPLGAAIVVGGQAVINPGGTTALLVLCAWYLLYLAVEAYLIAPKVVGRSETMPTVMVIIVTLAGGTLFGMLGALLGVPATVAASVIVEELRTARKQRRSPYSRADDLPRRPGPRPPSGAEPAQRRTGDDHVFIVAREGQDQADVLRPSTYPEWCSTPRWYWPNAQNPASSR